MPAGLLLPGGRGRGRGPGGDFAGLRDVEDGLAALSGGLLLIVLGGGAFGGVRGGRGRGHGEEGALVGLGVADEGGDVVVGEERVGEDFGAGEAGEMLAGVCFSATKEYGMCRWVRTAGNRCLGRSS